jgi:hypothetical protein
MELQDVDVTAFALADVKSANAALCLAIPAVAPIIRELAVGQRSNVAKLWAFYFKRNKTYSTLTDGNGKAFPSLSAWLRDYFRVPADDKATFDQYQNAVDYLARAGAALAGETDAGKAKRSALASLQAAVATYMPKILADSANLADVHAMIAGMSRDYRKAVAEAESKAEPGTERKAA